MDGRKYRIRGRSFELDEGCCCCGSKRTSRASFWREEAAVRLTMSSRVVDLK